MAIARGASTTGSGGTGTSLTFASPTITTNTYAVVSIFQNDNTGDTVTGVTLNGVAMTRANTVQNNSAPFVGRNYQYVLPGSTTGNVVISSSSANLEAWCTTFSGAQTSGTYDATNTATGNGTTPSLSLTTVADQCWIVSLVRDGTGAVTISSNTNTGNLYSQFSPNEACADSNGAVSAGANTVSFSNTTTQQWQLSAVSFAPVASPSSKLALLGVG